MPDKSAIKVVQTLLDKGIIHIYEQLHQQYSAKKESFIFLTPTYQEEQAQQQLLQDLERAPKQSNLFLTYLHLFYSKKEVKKQDLLKLSETDSSVLNALVKKGVFEIQQLHTDRLSFEYDGDLLVNQLTPSQQKAYNSIQEAFQNKLPVLFKGITGSGKTHIYIELIQQTIARKQQVLYLLPEIALTAQIIRKLRSYLGSRLDVYHSKFTNQERVELWHKVLSHDYDIVVGARSALMLPFKNLGLIIVDEEHDASYKQQDPSPRYHARDAALMLAQQANAPIILGSATPSFESYFNVQQNKYKLVELPVRFGDLALPTIHLVDTKQELLNKTNKAMFSSVLLQKIEESLQAKKQIILFQNRRGYAPFIICKVCGWVPHCNFCDVSLTYHKQSDQLHCHYCGTKSQPVKVCMACGSNKMGSSSYGTEKIEEEIKKLFPKARVQRFDWDALRIKNKYQEVIQRFEKQQIDILVGTQMLVKGLDFEHVNLVGVLSADSLLAIPDFRIHEKVYQTLEQVSGRAGRKGQVGQVVIQLFKTNHPAIQFVTQHDYHGFYLHELQEREEFQYPPFTRLIRITLKHKDQLRVYEAAQKYFERIQQLPQTSFFGPAEPGINRIKNLYIQEILLKLNRDQKHLRLVKQQLKEAASYVQLLKGMSNIIIQLDVDPF